ncbi:Sulfotransferase family protein [Roseovarius lutimaris]|uniref:Sulfotransferase family protein n=1 Tax=Roseovarius lutimaris TaxID=1005928 RepID=A0A1I5GPB6_9RHOB|nr:sulfotransferase [Roseovarius lutimaris]SFO37391.1 Sulfotransferase family protein [Roseovarius lutimaris]
MVRDVKEKPLIVCGMGRSGTRTVADILSSHGNIQLYGEIPPQMIVSFFNHLTTVDRGYLKNESFSEDWKSRKSDYIFQTLNFLSKGYIEKVKHSRTVCGYKSPRHERFFLDIEKHFRSVDLSPHYIYCIRDPLTCWASYKSMPWNSFTLETFMEDYKQSISEYFSMKESAGDRVHIFKLNEYMEAPDRVTFFLSRFLKPLGVSDDGRVRKTILSDQNRNATSTVIGKKRETLSVEETQILKDDANLWSVFT